MKKNITVVFFISFLASFTVFSQGTENMTIATYYPSPNGVYRELRAQRVIIGENYYDSTHCWPPAVCTNQIDEDADLVVEGNVGIGIGAPQAKLDVAYEDTAPGNSGLLWLRGYGTGTLIGDPQVTFGRAGGTIAAPTDIQANWVLGGMWLSPRINGTFNNTPHFGSVEAWSEITDPQSSRWLITTRDNSSGTPVLLTAMMIRANGNTSIAGNLRIGEYTLPATDGTTNQTLVTNGSGTVSWAAGTGPDVYTLPSISCSSSSACSSAATKGGKLKILTGTVSMPAVNVWATISWTNTPFTTIHNVVATVEKTGSSGTNEVGCKIIPGSSNSVAVINDVTAGKVHFVVIGE